MTLQFTLGDVIDERFEVAGVCSDSGGMGTILHVKDQQSDGQEKLVLKYCKLIDSVARARFCREIRILDEFRGNHKVIQLVYSNLEHDPPFFVMNYYADGDLSNRMSEIQSDVDVQEKIFLQMCDAVGELHLKDIYHRDIKPPNFLIDGDHLRIADLGLVVDRESVTRMTSTGTAWGTEGFEPPESRLGGFKEANSSYDIFMLGKSMYALLSGLDPLYVTQGAIHPAIYAVIERCCEIDPHQRYKTVVELKQAIVYAYDVIGNRVDGVLKCKGCLESILGELDFVGECSVGTINDFAASLQRLDDDDQEMICKEMTPEIWYILSGEDFSSHHSALVSVYEKMAKRCNFGFGFAERIANCMEKMFYSEGVDENVRAKALSIAISAAIQMNRFAAMETCGKMIKSVSSENLAIKVGEILKGYPNSFVANIEGVSCQSDIIVRAIKEVKGLDEVNGEGEYHYHC